MRPWLIFPTVVFFILGPIADGQGTLRPIDSLPLTNLIYNGNFEIGKAPWWGPGFSIIGGSSSNSGSWLKVTGGFACQDKIRVEGGKRYRISMKIRADAAPDDSIFVQLSFRGLGVDKGWRGPAIMQLNGRTEAALFVTGGSHNWQNYSAVIAAPKRAGEMLMYLRKRKNTSGFALYDDVVIARSQDPMTTAADLKRAELARLLAPVKPGTRNESLRRSRHPNTSEPILLADNGHSNYHIYVGKEHDLLTLNAAAELANYLQQITTAKFVPLLQDTNDSDKDLLVIGRDNDLTQYLAPDIPYNSLGGDGFAIRTVGRDVIIAGATPRGTMYGVNWFLDRKLGIKWLGPNYTYVPHRTTLMLKPVNEIQIPRFHYREVLSAEGSDKRFRAHNLLNGESHGPSFLPSPPEIDSWVHEWSAKGGEANFWQLLPPKRHLLHPSWYAGGQIAMMNADVRKEMAAVLIARLKALPDYRRIWFEVHDMDWGWKMDPASQRFADMHGGRPSAPRLDMMIDIANRVRQVLPGAKFAFNAYHWSFAPPGNMKVPDYIMVVPMTIGVDYSTPLNVGRNVALGRDIATWNAIAKHVLVWDHITNFSGFIQPTPNIYPIAKSIKWLATLDHVNGYFAEGSWNTPGAEFASLRAWLIARLLWNPNQSARHLVAEYCRLYFGKTAGAFIARYIDLMHEAIAKSGDLLAEKTQVDMKMFNLQFIREADQLFDRAEAAAAGNAVNLKHVRIARMPLDYIILVRRHEYRIEAERSHQLWNDDFNIRYTRLMNTIRSAGVKQYRQEGGIDELVTLLNIRRHNSLAADGFEKPKRSGWFELQELSFNRYGRATWIVSDPIASDGATARMRQNSSTWAIHLKLDKLPKDGCWNVFFYVRSDGYSSLANQLALRVGSYPAGSSEIFPLPQIDRGYHQIEVPGGPFRHSDDREKGIFLQSALRTHSKFIFVDRATGQRTSCVK